MKEGFEKLQELGAQKIHEDTHIARAHVQAVIHESFEDLNRVQFLGFVSILEREYNLDLSELKNSGLLFFDEDTLSTPEKKGVFVLSKQEKKPTLIYVLLAIVLVGLVTFFVLNSTSSESAESSVAPKAKENKIINKVKKDLETKNIVELNTSDVKSSIVDLNLTKSEELNVSKSLPLQATKALKPFIIKAKKVWIGYIDVKSRKKYQETFRGELALKRDKEWLLILGHAHVKFYVNGKAKTFNSSKNLYMHYKNGTIEKLTLKEFKKLNRGRKW